LRATHLESTGTAKLSDEADRSGELAASVAALWERVEALARDNAELRRALTDRSAVSDPADAWIALKAAPRGAYSYEGVRSWCESGLIEAKKEGGRWYVRVRSLSERLARLKVNCPIAALVIPALAVATAYIYWLERSWWP
jgi:hypothetical protein